MTLRSHEFDLIVKKLGLVVRDTDDLHAWFEHNGQIITRTRRSKKKGVDLPFQHSIRQQLKLTESQLASVIGCGTDRQGYVEILRTRGLIPIAPQPLPATEKPKALPDQRKKRKRKKS